MPRHSEGVQCPDCDGKGYTENWDAITGWWDECELCCGLGVPVLRIPLCETRFLGLRPDVLYKFHAVSGCAKCAEAAAPYVDERGP